MIGTGKLRHGSWRAFKPAMILLALALVPPILANVLDLTGVIDNYYTVQFTSWWFYVVTLPFGMIGILALIGGVISFVFWKSN